MSKSVAVIPARSGSQRIPGKNFKSFNGKPIIAYSIEVALRTGLFDRVVVSTDSPEIAKIAKSFGAEVPFLRPDKISDAYAPIAEVLIHALQWFSAEEKMDYEFAAVILATAPLIQANYLKDSFQVLQKNNCAAVVPVTTFPYPIQRALNLESDQRLKMIWPENEMVRSNDLTTAYHDIGQFYWVRCQNFLKTRRFLSNDSMGYPIPRHYVQDIDNDEDWKRVEILHRCLMADS